MSGKQRLKKFLIDDWGFIYVIALVAVYVVFTVLLK